ncbi:hypothetical protein DMENIID0001_121420 [Sergentomyia squamirostris]
MEAAETIIRGKIATQHLQAEAEYQQGKNSGKTSAIINVPANRRDTATKIDNAGAQIVNKREAISTLPRPHPPRVQAQRPGPQPGIRAGVDKYTATYMKTKAEKVAQDMVIAKEESVKKKKQHSVAATTVAATDEPAETDGAAAETDAATDVAATDAATNAAIDAATDVATDVATDAANDAATNTPTHAFAGKSPASSAAAPPMGSATSAIVAASRNFKVPVHVA